MYAPCLSPPLGEKLLLVGLLTHTSRRLCRQRISPPSQHKPVTRFHGKRIRSVLTATYPSAPSGAGPCSGISPDSLVQRTRIRVPPGQAGSRKCHKSRSSIFNCASIIYRPTGKVNPLPQATPHRPAGGRVPLPYPLPGVPAPRAAPWTYGWWDLRH